jgi:hypothetical protein
MGLAWKASTPGGFDGYSLPAIRKQMVRGVLPASQATASEKTGIAIAKVDRRDRPNSPQSISCQRDRAAALHVMQIFESPPLVGSRVQKAFAKCIYCIWMSSAIQAGGCPMIPDMAPPIHLIVCGHDDV